MKFFIKDKEKNNLGILKLSVYLAATGPFHHDIDIEWLNVISIFYNFFLQNLTYVYIYFFN